MTDAQGIFELLTERGITVWAEGSRLRYRSAKGVFTEELRRQLQSHKKDVISAWRHQAANDVAVHPATYGQKALWILQQTNPESSAYNVLFSARIRSAINVSAFQNACQALVDRHPALRTTFAMEGDVLVQRIRGYLKTDLQVHECHGISLEEIKEKGIQRSRVAFNLADGPLLRVDLFSREAHDHVLLIAVHHIAADGWSIFLLLDELRQLYPAECGEAIQAPTQRPSKDVVAFGRWQEEMLASDIGRSHERYWIQAFEGDIPVLTLPTIRPRSSTVSEVGSSVPVELDAELSSVIRRYAAASGTTPYVVLLSAYQILLHRHSGQTAIIVGSPTYGRDQPEFANVVGEFVNMIPLKADFGDDPTFGDFLAEMRQRVIAGIEHQDYPFPLLVERLQPRRDPSHTPIFQTIFILQKFTQMAGLEAIFSGTASIDFAGLLLEAFEIPQQEGQVDISLELAEFGGVYKGQLKYKTDLFDGETITRLVRRYKTLLCAALAAPQTPVSRLPLLDSMERRALLEDFNATVADYPRGQTVVDLFIGQAARQPETVAVRYNGTTLTYGQLASRSDQLARHLLDRDVKPDSLVGLCLERSGELLVAILGILKAGAAYVPLDPGFPRERLTYMLEDCAAPLLLTDSTLGPRLFPETKVAMVNLDTDATEIGRHSLAPLPALSRPENRAYVLYTSGSSGRPKGVEIEHRALTNFLTSMGREPGFAENDVLLAVTTLSFDIAGLELFLPLVTGAQLELAGRNTALDGVVLARLLEESKATVMQATPATWRMLFESGWRGSARLKVLCGGEAMGRDLASQLLPVCHELWNLYGPTETTIWSSIARICSADDISIGHPIANTQMYVLDAHREPMPVGVVGELWIGGDGVARGYLNRADLTAERFVDNPFHPGRMYRTGDRARYRRDGRIDCLGRSDAQVKIRGFRIELEEIESVLAEHPAVTECAVVARELNGELRLVGYVAGTASPEDCREHLRNRLPEYMVPTAFMALSVLPKTPNNKINRNALPSSEASVMASGTEYVAPTSDTEKIIAKVFAEVLHLPTVGNTDNFFELGGHSLLATTALARLRKHFAIEVPLTALFQAPTTQGLSRWLDAVNEQSRSPGQSSAAQLAQLPRWKCLVPAQPTGSRPPLFLITGYMDAEDTLRILSNLISHLGSDQPLCGLRPRWLDGQSPLYTSVEELTQEYLADLRAFQPHGPYYLVGDCVGGVVAVEMAHKLIRQGETVALLALLDAERPRYHSFFMIEASRLWQRSKHIIEVLREFVYPTKGSRRQAFAEVFQRKLRRARLTNIPITATDHIYEQRTAYQRLLKRHRLKRYPGRITLILTDDVYRFIGLLGWKGFADGGLEIHRTPGDHETFRAQYSKELGKRLRQCVDRAQAEIEQRKTTATSNASNTEIHTPGK